MVTNRARQETVGIAPKNSKICSDDWHRCRFWSAFIYFGTHFAESFRMSKSSWMMDPARSREVSSCSASRNSKIISWISSIISGLVTVLCPPGRGESQVEKPPRFYCVTQFLTVAFDGVCSPNVSVKMACISFCALPCKKNLMELASRCCWNRAHRLTCFLSASVTRKDLQFGKWTDPSFQKHYRFRPTTSRSRSG